MRQILFRGKKLAGNEWVYGFYVHSSGGTSFKDLSGESAFRVHDFIMVPDGSENSVEGFPVVPDTVGQFTGMKDKHGVSIYEGDIVLKRTYNGKKPFRVTFGGGMFHCGFGGGSSTATHRYTLDDRSIEVIGNVFDNPELLQKDVR